MMNSAEFLEATINNGIADAKRDYSNPNNSTHPAKLKGAVAGFEACRGKNPVELGALLGEAHERVMQAHRECAADYWGHRCFEAEVEWVCNAYSAWLWSGGYPPLDLSRPSARYAPITY